MPSPVATCLLVSRANLYTGCPPSVTWRNPLRCQAPSFPLIPGASSEPIGELPRRSPAEAPRPVGEGHVLEAASEPCLRIARGRLRTHWRRHPWFWRSCWSRAPLDRHRSRRPPLWQIAAPRNLRRCRTRVPPAHERRGGDQRSQARVLLGAGGAALEVCAHTGNLPSASRPATSSSKRAALTLTLAKEESRGVLSRWWSTRRRRPKQTSPPPWSESSTSVRRE
jgi:hypothetical protein